MLFTPLLFPSGPVADHGQCSARVRGRSYRALLGLGFGVWAYRANASHSLARDCVEPGVPESHECDPIKPNSSPGFESRVPLAGLVRISQPRKDLRSSAERFCCLGFPRSSGQSMSPYSPQTRLQQAGRTDDIGIPATLIARST